MTVHHKILIILNGTMGAGKTTYSNKLQFELEKLNFKVFNEGYDKYIVNGANNAQEALDQIQHSLSKINLYKDDNVAVIADTCGDKHKNNNIIFGIDLSDFKRFDIYPNYNEMDFDGYLKWTLYNVLSRHTRIDTIGSNYNVNPVDNGVNTCTSIHKNKAQLVFNKNISDIICSNNIDECLSELQSEYDRYQKYVDLEHNFDLIITCLISKFIQ